MVLYVHVYLYAFIPLLAVHANQKHFHWHVHASAAQMQWLCREIVYEELAQGPYIVAVSDKARTRTLQVSMLQAERRNR